MTPLHGVWISSCVGAVLFWLAGYLIGQRRRTDGAAAPARAIVDGPDPARLQGELKAALDRELRLVADLSIARGELTGLRQAAEQLTELRAELEAARREREVAALEARDARAVGERSLAAASHKIAMLEERLAKGEPGDPSRGDRTLARLEQELERARAESATRETESKRLRASLDQLQAEKKELAARVAAGPAPTRSRPKSENEKLEAEAERLRVAILHARSERDGAVARARELEAELQRFRQGTSPRLGPGSPAAEVERLKQELRLSRNELARAEEALAESNLAKARPLRGEGAVAASTPLPPGELGELVRSLLDEVARSGRTRGAVVADGAGLVIAASGGDGEALAAAAAVFVESAGRVLRSVLPLGPLQNLSVVDENDVTIAALPLAVGDHPLILATLSDGPGPDPASLRAVVARA